MIDIQRFLNKHSPLILTIVASGGVIITAALSVKATPKAIDIINNKEKEKGEKLTTFEKIRYGWKPYVPAIFSGVGTIVCIGGIEYLNKKTQASIISAYTLLNNTYTQYTDNIKKLCGKETDILAKQEIVQAQYDDNYIPFGDELLFFDYEGMRFFTSTMDHVLAAETKFKESLMSRGYATLNEYYAYLGLQPVEFGYQLGWADIETCDPYNVKELEFNYEKTYVGEQKIECWIISPNIPAAFDYII